ncbi:hypothetical protein FQY83_03050 [Luteimonas marina]|uniref:Uncharacterized protein n=1 Tax=Luteimonas marina TaxID=488485 RepID=A0A5C5UBB6_9GAMM|nr:hypothetical protein FQY83_03050 [Luteimonas marina]
MTLPDERARALVWAGGFLVELARNASLPLRVRQRAVLIARHFPTAGEVMLAATVTESGTGVGLVLGPAEDGRDWMADCPQGPLTMSTRLEWPEE